MTISLVEIVNLPVASEKLIMHSGYRSFVQLEAPDYSKSLVVMEYTRHQRHGDIVRRYLTENGISFSLEGTEELNQVPNAPPQKTIKVPTRLGKNYSIVGMGSIFMNMPVSSFYSPTNSENEYEIGMDRVLAHFFNQELLRYGWRKLD